MDFVAMTIVSAINITSKYTAMRLGEIYFSSYTFRLIIPFFHSFVLGNGRLGFKRTSTH